MRMCAATRAVENGRINRWSAEPGMLNSVELSAQLEDLKERLLKPVLASISNAELGRELLWATREAMSIAWMSICPLLVLPALLEEKIHGARQHWQKQERLRLPKRPTHRPAEAQKPHGEKAPEMRFPNRHTSQSADWT